VFHFYFGLVKIRKIKRSM